MVGSSGLAGSSGSDLVYKIPGSDPDSAFSSRMLIVISGSDQLMNYVFLTVMMEASLLILLKIFGRIDCTIRVY